ncbi:MAG: fructose-bisphosphate aldolase [Thermaerobacter sp.]|nr:fructose-bisphosphate aldolase [Thermaerobacter sp.]
MLKERSTLPTRLSDLPLSAGKKARLHRLLYQNGPANGTLLLLPIDQGLEHGPRDFFPNPAAADAEFQLRIAEAGGYSGIAMQIGLSEKYFPDYAGRVPLILKLNGKTEIPNDDAPLSPLNACVEDAVRLGADAVGYTLYVGSARQDEDFRQFESVRRDAERFGMPVIVWSYPRGKAVEQKGGKDSFYAIDYAARAAQELGADVVKLNVPKVDAEKAKLSPAPYKDLALDQREILQHVVQSAGRTLVIFAGGEKGTADEVVAKAGAVLEAGATGLIFGRNIWQRPYDEAVSVSLRIRDLLQHHPR